MITSSWWRLNISTCIMFKILAFFIIMLYARLYVRVGISLTCGKHLHNLIICLRGLVHKTSLILPLSIEVSVAIQESGEFVYVCVRYIDYASVYDFFAGFWNCSNRMVFFVFIVFLITSINVILFYLSLTYWIPGTIWIQT